MGNSEISQDSGRWPLGWRAKIGILMPSHDDGTATYEYQRLCPEGVVPLQTRVMGGNQTLANLMRMREDALYGATLLATAKVDVISFIGTTAGFIVGVAGDKAMIKEIEEKTGVKTTTGSSAVADALRVMGIKKALLYAPYTEELAGKVIEYLAECGIAVPDHECLGMNNPHLMSRISPWETYGDVMKLYRRHPDTEGIFIICGCMRTLEIIETLEKDTGLPLITTTLANVWRCLQLAGVKDPVYGFGKLLAMPR